MKEATVVDQVVSEAPKGSVKKGTKASAPKVEGAEKKDRAPRVGSADKFRILSGVDATKWRGQRQIIAKTLQAMGDGSFTAQEIADKVDGLQTKTPLLASVTYHLKGLVADKQVELIPAPKPAKAEAEAKAAEETAA